MDHMKDLLVMWDEAVVAYLKVLLQYFPGYGENNSFVYAANAASLQQRFKSCIFWMPAYHVCSDDFSVPE